MSCFFCFCFFFFFFNDTATTEIYTLSLHDALPISGQLHPPGPRRPARLRRCAGPRSEEHTSELQSHHDLVCRLLLEKKKNKKSAGAHNKKQRVKQRNVVRGAGE